MANKEFQDPSNIQSTSSLLSGDTSSDETDDQEESGLEQEDYEEEELSDDMDAEWARRLVFPLAENPRQDERFFSAFCFTFLANLIKKKKEFKNLINTIKKGNKGMMGSFVLPSFITTSLGDNCTSVQFLNLLERIYDAPNEEEGDKILHDFFY